MRTVKSQSSLIIFLSVVCACLQSIALASPIPESPLPLSSFKTTTAVAPEATQDSSLQSSASVPSSSIPFYTRSTPQRPSPVLPTLHLRYESFFRRRKTLDARAEAVDGKVSDPSSSDMNGYLYGLAAETDVIPPLQAWVDYYAVDGTYIGDENTTTGNCLILSIPSWGIINITPMRGRASTDKDELVVYNDKDCKRPSRSPGSRTGLILFAPYFRRMPQSIRWTRTSVLPPPPPPPLVTTTSSSPPTTTTAALPSQPVTTTPTDTITTTLTLSTPTPSTTDPTRILPTFPTALIPPKPLRGNAWEEEGRCQRDRNRDGDPDGCKSEQQVNQMLVIGIVIAILVVGLMAAGSYYIYRTFYKPESLSEAFRSETTSARQANGSADRGSRQIDHIEDLILARNQNKNSNKDRNSSRNSYNPNQNQNQNHRNSYISNSNSNSKNGILSKHSFSFSRSPTGSGSRTQPSLRNQESTESIGFKQNSSDINLIERTSIKK